MKYICDVCGYVYDEELGDPDNGIAAGTKWEDLPDDFVCPLCGVGKEDFSKESEIYRLLFDNNSYFEVLPIQSTADLRISLEKVLDDNRI